MAVVPPPLTFAIRGPIAREDLPGLTARVCALLDAGGSDRVVCDVGGVIPDAVAVDALARLQLAAQRYGCTVRLRGGTPELRALVTLMGLDDVLVDRGSPRCS